IASFCALIEAITAASSGPSAAAPDAAAKLAAAGDLPTGTAAPRFSACIAVASPALAAVVPIAAARLPRPAKLPDSRATTIGLPSEPGAAAPRAPQMVPGTSALLNPATRVAVTAGAAAVGSRLPPLGDDGTRLLTG